MREFFLGGQKLVDRDTKDVMGLKGEARERPERGQREADRCQMAGLTLILSPLPATLPT
jgi:hypothetical protein